MANKSGGSRQGHGGITVDHGGIATDHGGIAVGSWRDHGGIAVDHGGITVVSIQTNFDLWHDGLELSLGLLPPRSLKYPWQRSPGITRMNTQTGFRSTRVDRCAEQTRNVPTLRLTRAAHRCSDNCVYRCVRASTSRIAYTDVCMHNKQCTRGKTIQSSAWSSHARTC